MRPIRLAKRFQIHKNFRALLQMNEIRAESFWQESWSHFYVITSIRSKPNTTIQQQQQQREKKLFFLELARIHLASLCIIRQQQTLHTECGNTHNSIIFERLTNVSHRNVRYTTHICSSI